jgi:DNA replication protein DnaC
VIQAPRSIEEWERDKQRGEIDPQKRLRQARIPEKYRECTWEGYRATAGTSGPPAETLKDILRGYVDGYPEATHDGLVLIGPPGYGKTLGAALVAKTLCLAGYWVKYTTYASLVTRRMDVIRLEKVADRVGGHSEESDEAERARYRLDFVERECDLLVLDDVGKEYRAKSGWSDDGLDALLRNRVEASKATLITSNLPLQDWTAYNVSMASFLHEVGEVITIDRGQDQRPTTRRKRA